MRLIARLDIKNESVIKGIQLEGLRKVGDPNSLAREYYAQGIDEIVLMDAVASLYDRNNVFHIVEDVCRDIFVPIAIGGGIRSVSDVSRALDSGADKVVVNTAAVRNISLIEEVAVKFGSQSLVGSIEAKKSTHGWKAYIDNGREPTEKNVTEWAKVLQDAGCGEILLTSVDMEGSLKGFDIELVEAVNSIVKCPVIVSGGCGKPDDVARLVERTQPSAVALAGVLHYKKYAVSDFRSLAS